ncbi:MAG: hypothetical protein JWQ20_1659 [Conexibacter sp.]|nr:hypothetical protein [Conexibacter sp.]
MYLRTVTVDGFRASAESQLKLTLPGRFAVMVGANGAGKTTLCDAIYLAHGQRFPQLPRMSSANLGAGTREISVEYAFEADSSEEGTLGRQLLLQASSAPTNGTAGEWSRSLGRNLGSVRSEYVAGAMPTDGVRLIYLPAWRNPLDELARREARILVELLRAQQQHLHGNRNLSELRARASGFLEALAQHDLIELLEDRIAGHLASLSAGVSQQWPYVRGQVVDDAYLARVLELMLAVIEGRPNSRPLDVSGLGYVNLLHIAVTLAAIPDASPAPATEASGEPATDSEPPPAAPDVPPTAESVDLDAETSRRIIDAASAEAEAAEDSFFPAGPFHATVIIEEPEAHLHPQLQHSLVRYLRRVVQGRKDIQVVLSSHASDIITSCHPDDLVVVRRFRDGSRAARSVANIPLDDRETVIRKARLHLDSSRSAALFAERLVLVEGVTDAAVVRELGWAWAGADATKQAFIDAVSIVPMGTRVGEWPVSLLATKGFELCDRVAILSDSDKLMAETPQAPGWLAKYDPDVVCVFHSHPTLEPSITAGNESQVRLALTDAGLDAPADVTPANVDAIFRGQRKRGGVVVEAAGPGATRKGQFALALADRMMGARDAGSLAFVPRHVEDLFHFVFPDGAQAFGDAAPEAEPDNPPASPS